MVGFAFPTLLLGFAAGQHLGPLVHADHVAVMAATAFTRRHGLTEPLVVIQEITQPVFVYGVATVVVAWIGVARGLVWRATWAFVTMMVAWGIGAVSKLVVQRARPVLDDPVAHARGFSFPSGHALNITVASSVLIVALWPLMSAVARRLALGLGGTAIVLVGLDRVLLGVHFPTDIVAGFVMGAGITLSSWAASSGRTSVTSSSAWPPPDLSSGA